MKVATATDLGNLVQSARHRAGWTQQELAKRSGASRLWVQQVESGHSGASLGKVLKLLAALGLAMDVDAGRKSSAKLDRYRSSLRPAPAGVELQQNKPGEH